MIYHRAIFVLLNILALGAPRLAGAEDVRAADDRRPCEAKEAAARKEESKEELSTAQAHIALAQCLRDNGMITRAAEAYNHTAELVERSISTNPTKWKAGHAKLLRTCATNLSKLQISLPMRGMLYEVHLDGRHVFPWEFPLAVDPGDHSVTVSAPGYTASTQTFHIGPWAHDAEEDDEGGCQWKDQDLVILLFVLRREPPPPEPAVSPDHREPELPKTPMRPATPEPSAPPEVGHRRRERAIVVPDWEPPPSTTSAASNPRRVRGDHAAKKAGKVFGILGVSMGGAALIGGSFLKMQEEILSGNENEDLSTALLVGGAVGVAGGVTLLVLSREPHEDLEDPEEDAAVQRPGSLTAGVGAGKLILSGTF